MTHQSFINPLLRHVLERLSKVFRAEGQLADGPDLGVLVIAGVCQPSSSIREYIDRQLGS